MRLASSGRKHAVFNFGNLQVTSLRDGYVDMPTTRLRDQDAKPLDPVPDVVPLIDGQLRLSVNAFFIDDGNRALLVDTGASNAWHSTMGELLGAFAEAGIDRRRVTDVAITHNHEDHVNGVIAPDGSEAFPALERLWIGAKDISVFTGRLAPIRNRVVPITKRTAINDWATALPTPGHTPGHTVYEVRSSAGRLLLWGDTVHVPSLQFTEPTVSWELDDNPERARAARIDLLAQLSEPNHFVAGAHLGSPGVAKVAPAGDGFSLTYVGQLS